MPPPPAVLDVRGDRGDLGDKLFIMEAPAEDNPDLALLSANSATVSLCLNRWTICMFLGLVTCCTVLLEYTPALDRFILAR